MFKLESYITPILLSYVEKYVKDIKAERSQVSLWGGDAVFSNLDLRLDVLERELGLPFSVVSGHIHELQIHVPWTRLNTEPIVITINTIECVLKLPGNDNGTESETSSSVTSSSIAEPSKGRKTNRKEGQQEAPPGYVQSLINKIISNLKIVCNNLILKYVEDDIVLSLNTRWLCLTSANEIWEPAFTELSQATGLVLRKLLQVKDMTICLDKRNASGKIETYQEPLLYRSSLSVHAAWCYDSPLSKIPRTSRFDVRSQRLEFSITDTQLPMFLRIFNLVLALHSGELDRGHSDHFDESANDGNDQGGEDELGHGQSWSGWAWNVGSSVGSALLPIYWEEEDSDIPYLAIKKDKVVHFGVYVDSASLVLKLTERQKEKNLFGSTKLCFTPFARLDVSGVVQEVIAKGVNAVNVTGGVSHIQVIPLGDCVCGSRDTAFVDSEHEPFYLKTGNDKLRNFLKGSLFEKDFGHEESNVEPKEKRRIYEIDWDAHLERISEEVLLDRTPAVALDFLYFFEIPEDFTSEQLSEISDLEHSDLPEKSLCRIVFGPTKFKLCSGSLHRMQMVEYALSQYDYLPYVELEEPDDPVQVSDEEELQVPVRIFQVTAINPTLAIYHTDHPSFTPSQSFLMRSAGKGTPAMAPTEHLPFICMKMEYVDGHVVHPMYPRRLVERKSTQLQNCYLKASAKLLNVSCQLCHGEQSASFLKPSNFQVGYKSLMLADHWPEDCVTAEYSLGVQSSKVRFTHPQLLAVYMIAYSYWINNPKPMKHMTMMDDALTKRLPVIALVATGGRCQCATTKLALTLRLNVANAACDLSCKDGGNQMKVVPLISKSGPQKGDRFESLRSHDFVEACLQVPLSHLKQDSHTIVSCKLSDVALNLDPKLEDWISYSPTVKPTVLPARDSEEKLERHQRETSVLSRKSSRYHGRSGTSDKGTLVSSKKRVKTAEDEVENTNKWMLGWVQKWNKTLNSALVQIKMGQLHVYLPKTSLIHVAAKTVQETVLKAEKEQYLYLVLPRLTLENVSHKPVIDQFLADTPIKLPDSVWNVHRENLPLTLQLTGFSLSTNADVLLPPVNTSCTLGLSSRQHNAGTEVAIPTLSVCLHADMSAVDFSISSQQLGLVISVAEHVLGTLHKISCKFAKDRDVIEYEDITDSAATFQPPLDFVPPVQSVAETISDKTHVTKPPSSTENDALSLWIQWTIPQLTFAAVSESGKAKLQLEMEDFLSSFDWTPIYFQMKLRLLTANINHFKTNAKREWVPGDNKGIVLSCSDELTHDLHTINIKNNNVEILPHSRHLDAEQVCFSATFTRAQCKESDGKRWKDLFDSHKKLFEEKGEEGFPHFHSKFVSEIDVKVGPLDVVIVNRNMMPFLKMATQLMAIKLPVKEPPPNNPSRTSIAFNNNNLPLVYFKAKTIRLFLITENREQKNMDKLDFNHSALNPDVMVFNCDSVSVSPQVENVLARVLVRPEIYHLCKAKGVLETPGSFVEDRQYQIDAVGLGIFTGRWCDVDRKSEKPAKPVLRTMGENPALEWNTSETLSGSGNNKTVDEVFLMPLLVKFDLQTILAPAIVYTVSMGNVVRSKLIAGHAFEINAQSEIAVTCSTNQIELMSLFCQETLSVVQVLLFPGERLNAKKQVPDSGIDCGSMQLPVEPHAEEPVAGEAVTVPLDILITGSKISTFFFRLSEAEKSSIRAEDKIMWRKYRYKHRRLEIMKNRGEQLTNDDSETSTAMGDVSVKAEQLPIDQGYDASEEGSIEEPPELIVKIHPLIYTSISQPHFLTTLTRNSQRLELSFYDSMLNVSPKNYFITCGGHRVPLQLDFQHPIYQTKPGEPDKKLGIPPALITLKVTDFLNGETKVSLNVERPLKFNLSVALYRQLQCILKTLRDSSGYDDIVKLLVNDEPQPQTTSRSFEFKELALETKQLLLKIPIQQHDGEISLGVSQIQSKCSMSSSKMMKISTSIESLIVKTTIGIYGHRFVGPWSFNVNAEVDAAHADPSLSLRVKSTLLPIQVGPNHILALDLIKKHWNEHFPSFERQPEAADQEQQPPSVLANVPSSNASNNEQQFLDDLRAGAFQYVSGGELRVYQVLFNDRERTMTWKYPQPRTLTRVSVFPVPIKKAADIDSTSSNFEVPAEVNCALQYWDVCLGCFRTYSEFQLSELKVSHLDLPLTSDRKKMAMSSTWRVLLDHQEDFDQDQVERDIIVKPKSLVSVMRVDSYVNQALVPRIQAAVDVSKLRITLHNHLHFCGHALAAPYNRYNLDQAFPLDHPVASFVLDGTVVGVDVWKSAESMQANCRLKTQLMADFVDYRFLANHHLIHPCKVETRAFVVAKPSGQLLTDARMAGKSVGFRFGHFAAHTLSTTLNIWSDVLQSEERTSLQPLTHYLVCNNTQESVRFGQASTDENILLKPMEANMYAWRSQRASLQLWLCVEGLGYWRWCEPFGLNADEPQVRKIDHGTHVTTVVVTLKPMAQSTQKQVVINGLISTASLLSDHLEVRAVLHRHGAALAASATVSTEDNSHQQHRTVLSSFQSAPSFLLEPEYIQGIKIRLLGIGTPWSGDIPLTLQKGRSSVLVRVPLKEKGHCLTVWCRLLTEPINATQSKCLLLFSPMYVSRSLLPNPVQLKVASQQQQQQRDVLAYDVPLPGKGAVVQLATPGPSDQKYSLSFQVVEDLPPSDPVTMSWGTIEQIRDKHIVVPSIDAVVDDVHNFRTLSDWTYGGEQNEQPQTNINVKFVQFHPLCNTLCIEVQPWCLIVNELGLGLLVKVAANKEVYRIKDQSVLVPPTTLQSSTFQIGFVDHDGKEWFGSLLQLATEDSWNLKQTLMPSLSGMIPNEGVVETRILCGQQVCFLTLQCQLQRDVRILKIKPTFSVTNLTEKPLQIAALSSFKTDETSPESVDYIPQEILPEKTDHLLFWQFHGKDEEASDGPLGQYSVAASTSGSEWSAPCPLSEYLLLDNEDCRLTMSIPGRDSNQLLVVTVHKRDDGSCFLLFKTDVQPQFVIYNRLDSNLTFKLDYHQERKLRFDSEDIGAGKKCLFTMQWAMNNLSKVEGVGTHLEIKFASAKVAEEPAQDWEIIGGNSKVRSWSEAVNTSLHHEHFVTVPGYGDVTVYVELVANTTHVYVEPVSKIEVSAKEIRSRICSSPNNTTDSEAADSFVTVPSLDRTASSFHSFNDSSVYKSLESTRLSTANEFQALVTFDEISFTLTDDCCESPTDLDEYVRLTLDCVCVNVIPRTSFAKPLRSLENGLPTFNDVSVTVFNAQIDNQMFRKGLYDFPIVMSTAAPSRVRPRLATQAFLKTESWLVVQTTFDTSVSNVIKSIAVKIDPIHVYVEDKFLFKMGDVAASLGTHLTVQPSPSTHPPKDVLMSSKNLENHLLLEDFDIEPLSVLVSVHASLKMFIGLDQSPLNFTPFARRSMMTTHYDLGQSLAKHYISGALFRAGWVVGSLDIIGSPAGFTRTVGEGVKDFVYLPYRGIFHGPWSFIGGLTNGSTSLIKHVSAGTLTSMTNFASSVSRNLDRLSLDDEHCKRNEVSRRARPQGFSQGLTNGLSGIGISILGAVGGIAHHPLRAFLDPKDDHYLTTNIVTGVARGLVGVVTKPLGGAAELVAQTGQGLLHGTGWCVDSHHRAPVIPEPVCAMTSGTLKYAWKLLEHKAAAAAVLATVDANQQVNSSSFVSVTLLLTPDTLHVMSVEEDVQSSVINLDQIEFIENDDDPTEFTLKVSEKPKSSSHEAQHHDDRVVQFVMESFCALSDYSANAEKKALSRRSKEDEELKVEELVFNCSPEMRQVLKFGLNLVQSEASRGFKRL